MEALWCVFDIMVNRPPKGGFENLTFGGRLISKGCGYTDNIISKYSKILACILVIKML